jgi:hypothetical protein
MYAVLQAATITQIDFDSHGHIRRTKGLKA